MSDNLVTDITNIGLARISIDDEKIGLMNGNSLSEKPFIAILGIAAHGCIH